MLITLTIFVLVINCNIFPSYSSNILMIFPPRSRSHLRLALALAEELVPRGHEITIVSSTNAPYESKNITMVTFKDFTYDDKERRLKLVEIGDTGVITLLKDVTEMLVAMTTHFHNDPSFRNILESNKTFDLVIVENLAGESFYGLGNYYNCPVIVLAPGPVSLFNSFLVSNPAHPAYVPNFIAGLPSEMNFLQRFQNTIYYIWGKYFVYTTAMSQYDAIMKKSYLPNGPDLYDIYHNISLVLTYSHASVHPNMPMVPALKEVGGFHIKKPKPLPKDLQKFLDDSPDGVILFSFGSYVSGTDLSAQERNIFINALGRLKQKVLWKFEAKLSNLPTNIKIMKWLPQNDVLAHPNVKATISHGGLLSALEAIYHGVPIITIPLTWDQNYNGVQYETKGYGINIPFKELSEEKLFATVNELLTNKKYTANVKKWSRIMKDDIVSPMDKAIFWIEYVIRNKGAKHLASPALKLYWYQELLLDIIAVSLLSLIGTIFIVWKLIKLLIKKYYRSNIYDDKKEK